MNARTTSSLAARVSVKRASWVTVANSSSLLAPRVAAAAERSLIIWLPAGPGRQRLGRRAEQVVEGAVGVHAVGAERLRQRLEAGVDPVQLDRARRCRGAGCPRRPAAPAALGVRRRELDEAVRDERRLHDDGLRALRDLHVAVVLDLDPHRVAVRATPR